MGEWEGSGAGEWMIDRYITEMCNVQQSIGVECSSNHFKNAVISKKKLQFTRALL